MVFTEIRWKFVIPIAAVAMIISLIAGIFGSVDFGKIIVRTLLGTMIFGCVAIGLDKIMLSLFNPQLPNSSVNEDSSLVGTRVDLVADDEIEDNDMAEKSLDTEISSAMDESESEDNLEMNNTPLPDNADNMKDAIGLKRKSFHSGDRKRRQETDEKKIEDILGTSYEASELAKAVKTVLNQGEKG